MNSHFDSAVLTDGSYAAQEVAEILNEIVLGHALVLLEQLLYLAHALGFPAGHRVAVRVLVDLAEHILGALALDLCAVI